MEFSISDHEISPNGSQSQVCARNSEVKNEGHCTIQRLTSDEISQEAGVIKPLGLEPISPITNEKERPVFPKDTEHQLNATSDNESILRTCDGNKE